MLLARPPRPPGPPPPSLPPSRSYFRSVCQSEKSFYRDKSTPLFVCLFSGWLHLSVPPVWQGREMKRLNHIHTHQVTQRGGGGRAGGTPSFLASLFPPACQPPVTSHTTTQISQRTLQFRKCPVVYRLAAAAQLPQSHRNSSRLAPERTTPRFCHHARKQEAVNVCLMQEQLPE